MRNACEWLSTGRYVMPLQCRLKLRCAFRMQGVWVKGIVDELRLDDLGKIVVVEVKSRRSNSLPSDAQKRTAELQVGDAQPLCYAVKSVLLWPLW